MLGADADADDPRRDPPQKREMVEQPHDPGRGDRFVGIEQRVDDPALNGDLHRLDHFHRKGASPLNCFEIMKAYIEAGVAGVHFEDQLASEKKCGHLAD